MVVQGTNGSDVAILSGQAQTIQVGGLPAHVSVTGAVAGNDTVTVQALAGDDVVDASGVQAGTASLTLDGGDVLIGGAGNDVILGGAGDDVLIGGPGDDHFDGGPGDNILIGGGGAGATP